MAPTKDRKPKRVTFQVPTDVERMPPPPLPPPLRPSKQAALAKAAAAKAALSSKAPKPREKLLMPPPPPPPPPKPKPKKAAKPLTTTIERVPSPSCSSCSSSCSSCSCSCSGSSSCSCSSSEEEDGKERQQKLREEYEQKRKRREAKEREAAAAKSSKKNPQKAKKKREPTPEEELKSLLYFDVDGYGLHSDIHFREPCRLEGQCFNFERFPKMVRPYITYRNQILRLWVRNSCRQVTFFDVMHHLPDAKYKSKRRFMKVIYDFLEQNCFINFGVFTVPKPRQWVGDRRRIIVIGAGVAGLAAARQLTYFDFDVVILEALPRFGGRCYTMVLEDLDGDGGQWDDPPAVINTGASFVSAAYNNPFLTLMKQLKIDPMGLTGKGKVFCDGEMLSPALEARLETLYLKMLALMIFMWGKEPGLGGDGWYSPAGEVRRAVSVDQALAFVYALLETATAADSTAKCEEKFRVLEALGLYVDQMSTHFRRFTETFQPMYFPRVEHCDTDERGLDQGDLFLNYHLGRLKAFLRSGGKGDREEDSPFSRLYDAHASFQVAQDNEDRFWAAYPDYQRTNKAPAIRVGAFASTTHRRILEWHKGVLEVLLGCRLSDLHAEAFVKDNAMDHTKAPFYLEYGYNELLDRLVQGAGRGQRPLPITLNAMVKEVELQPEGVSVRTIVNGKPIVVNGHACLITVPLGVLKKAVEEEVPVSKKPKPATPPPSASKSPSPPPSPPSPPPPPPPAPPKRKPRKRKGGKKKKPPPPPPPSARPPPPQPENKINFVPPLPPEKVSAIKRLGFGLTNKVVMGFEEMFWDREGGPFESEDFLGFVPVTSRSRSEFILFYLHDTLPIITGMIGGQAALDAEKESPDLVMTRAYNTLREIFVASEISIPYPDWYSVSAWGSNTFFRGTHSFTSVEATTEDYDTLAEPVALTPGAKPKGVPRLFFAGEHCSRKHQGTTHGAYESGLKAAAQIGWSFFPGRRYW